MVDVERTGAPGGPPSVATASRPVPAVRGSVNRMLALVLGIAIGVAGIVGLAVSAGLPFLQRPGALVLLFEVNPLQSVVHVLVGAVLVAAALRGQRVAMRTNTWVGFGLLALGYAGLYLVGSPANALALNPPVNTAHLGAAMVLLIAGLGADRVHR
jgi:hypothetical protein